jgi:hypothetical protein
LILIWLRKYFCVILEDALTLTSKIYIMLNYRSFYQFGCRNKFWRQVLYMSWDSIPNFGDPCAKIQERTKYGFKIIEVLYGALDAYGKPTSPVRGDGHGHWIAVELDGTYQMLSHRHPISEGGGEDYGKIRGLTALGDLENAIRDREGICQEAERLQYSTDFRRDSSKMMELTSKWKQIYWWGVPTEQRLSERFSAAKNRFYENRKYYRDQNAQKKRVLIQKASELASSFSAENASDCMKELMEQWKQIPSAGKEVDDQLWNEFQRERQTFYDRRKKAAQEREEQFQRNAIAKEQIVQEAQSIVRGGNYSKETAERMKALNARWKKIGFAGREKNDLLWGEFKSAEDDFWARKRSEDQRKHQEWEERQRERSQKQAEYQQKLREAIQRRQTKIANLYEQNSRLRDRAYSTRSSEKREQIGQWMLENESKIRQLQLEISDMESRLR